jgi:hypothetical protein
MCEATMDFSILMGLLSILEKNKMLGLGHQVTLRWLSEAYSSSVKVAF